jgi:hypothetical protein
MGGGTHIAAYGGGHIYSSISSISKCLKCHRGASVGRFEVDFEKVEVDVAFGRVRSIVELLAVLARPSSY